MVDKVHMVVILLIEVPVVSIIRKAVMGNKS